ncbi:MAG: tetratricopeptide repeat protein [Polyangiaceae bacterium]
MLAAAGLGMSALVAAAPVFAADPPRGAPVLARANSAWARGEFDVAEALFHESLEQGGLSRNDTLRAYVYMASARAVQGKRDQALSAFRQAVLIDPSFELPPEAGKKAKALGEQVRAREGRVGPFVLTAEIPARASSGSPFAVKLSMDASHAALLTRVGLTVSSGVGSAPYQFEQEVPQTAENTVKLKFDVPARVALPGSELRIKLAGLDRHDNELVTTEGHTKIAEGTGSAGLVAVHSRNSGTSHDADEDEGGEKKKSGGFWSGPLPYIIGGAVLVGAGAGVYFATRPGEDVSLASVRVQSQ